MSNPDAAWAKLTTHLQLNQLLARYMAQRPVGWDNMSVEGKKEWMEHNLRPTAPDNDTAHPVMGGEAPLPTPDNTAAGDAGSRSEAEAKEAQKKADEKSKAETAKTEPKSSAKSDDKK